MPPRCPRLALVLLCMACACTSTRREPEPEPREAKPVGSEHDDPSAPKVPEAPAPDELDERRWDCERDEDCVQTCALGAVNGEWLRDHPNADTCDDGCYWNHDGVRCRDGGCVTLDAEGNIDESCTRRSSSIFD